jgi:hypothetical protein
MFLDELEGFSPGFGHHLVLVKWTGINDPALDVFLARFQSHAAEQGLGRI